MFKDINNALNMGWRVIVPEETGGLPAIPYIKYDANTGSAGYMIATMAGGYSWEITPTGYEADLTFMKDILMEKNIKITYEVLDPPSPYLVAMGNYFLLVMKVVVEDVGGYGVRVIERNMIRIDTDFRNYKWGMWPLYAFFPGEYKIKFDGKELFVFKVWGVKITVEPSTITPGTENEPNTANVKAEIVPSDITIPDMKIKLKGDLELKSGGHSHESETNKRPVPRIKNSSDEWVQEYEFTVNNNKIETTFKPSMGANNTRRGIAGKYKIVAIYDGKEIAEKEVDVKYSLIQLTSGANYCLRSVDSNHNNGEYHYGTTDANQAIGEAAAKFIEDYGKDYTPQRKIVVNDQSLILGGLFDIDGDWDEPHQTHRDGRNVDIPYKYCDGGEVSVAVNSDEWKVLKSALALKFGETNILQEDDFNHFHCTK